MRKRLFGACLAGSVVAIGVGAAISPPDLGAKGQPPSEAVDRPPVHGGAESAAKDFVETATVLPSPDRGVKKLGDGHSPVQIFPSLGSAFEQQATRAVKVISNPKAELTIHLVSSEQALDKALNVNTELNARYLFAKVKAGVNVDRASAVAQSSLRLILTAEMDFGEDELVDPALHAQAKALLEQGRHKEFEAIYGSHYVYRQQRLSKVMFVITADAWSEKTQAALRVAVDGKVDLVVAGGDLKVRVAEDLRAASARGCVNIQVKTIGGNGIQDLVGMIHPVLKNGGPDFVPSLEKQLVNVVSKVNRETSGIGQVHVRSYREFGWSPVTTLWNQLFESKLQQCADDYRRGEE